MNVTEVLEWLQAREQTYRFLAGMYRTELSTEVLQSLAGSMAGGDQSDDSPGYRLLRRWAHELTQKDLAQARTDLAAEYARLFLNAGERPHVAPYESVYTSDSRLVMQEAQQKVLEAYRQEGLARSEAFPEPEDHLAVELEFMAHLCLQARQAVQDGDRNACQSYMQKQRAFLDEHLLRWAAQFTEDLERATRSDFYRALAQITRELLDGEQESVAELAAACADL